MKHTPTRIESAPSSVDTIGSLLDDGSRNLERDDNRRGGRKREKSRPERRGTDVKRMLTPLVKVLLFGVFLSFLDVFYIMKHLEESSEIETQIARNMAQTPSDDNNIKESNEQSEINQKSEIKKSIKNEQSEINQKSEIKKSIKDPLEDKEPILKLIRDAGISFDPVADAELIELLPTWSDVVELYGPEPVIYGLNEGNCERFQAQSDKGDHFIGTAGTFNTGTNLMSELLLANCVMPDRMKKHGNQSRGVRWQVPWGKHSPVGDKEFRNTHKTKKDALVDANEIMPMVTIRDPLIWLKSMCRHKYTAHWVGFQEKDRCPNFLMKDLKMKVHYDGFVREYDSVLHLWNEYYEEYKNLDIPVLIVRFEDLVFHPVETVTKICECGGGQIIGKKFHYIVNSAKKGDAAHGNIKDRTGFVDALVKYANHEKRYKDYHAIADLKYVRDNIDKSLLEMMQYSSIDPLWNLDHMQRKAIKRNAIKGYK